VQKYWLLACSNFALYNSSVLVQNTRNREKHHWYGIGLFQVTLDIALPSPYSRIQITMRWASLSKLPQFSMYRTCDVKALACAACQLPVATCAPQPGMDSRLKPSSRCTVWWCQGPCLLAPCQLRLAPHKKLSCSLLMLALPSFPQHINVSKFN